jgi:hypothetical protein
MTLPELRENVHKMSKVEMIQYRDMLEAKWESGVHWKNNFDAQMKVLSLGCINKFNTTLSRLK